MAMWHASEEEPADLSGVPGDAWLDIDRVSHDANTRTLTIPFAQEWEGGPMLEDPRDAPKSGLL